MMHHGFTPIFVAIPGFLQDVWMNIVGHPYIKHICHSLDLGTRVQTRLQGFRPDYKG